MLADINQLEADLLFYSATLRPTNNDIYVYIKEVGQVLKDYLGLKKPLFHFYYKQDNILFNSNNTAIIDELDIATYFKSISYDSSKLLVTNENLYILLESPQLTFLLFFEFEPQSLPISIGTIQACQRLYEQTLINFVFEQVKSNKFENTHKRSNTDLAQIFEMKKLSRDIKEHLTVIKGYNEVIKNNLPNTNEILRSIHYYIEIILNNIESVNFSLNKYDGSDKSYKEYIVNYYPKYEKLNSLVIDKSVEIPNLIMIWFNSASINCVTANSNDEIRNKVRQVELVILNETFDENNIKAVIEDIKQQNKNVVIIVMTTMFSPERKSYYKKMHVDYLISKPIEKNELFTIIDEKFASHKLDGKNLAQEIKYVTTPKTDGATDIFLNNLEFNYLAIKQAWTDKDYQTIKKISNIIRRTSGSMGMENLAIYSDQVFKAITEDNTQKTQDTINLLLNEIQKLINEK